MTEADQIYELQLELARMERRWLGTLKQVEDLETTVEGFRRDYEALSHAVMLLHRRGQQ